MSTWGPSKKRSTPKKSSSAASGSGSSKKTTTAKAPTRASAASTSRPKASGSVRDATPPEGEVAGDTSGLRGAVGGREHEFIGIGLIGLAVVLGLAVYVDLAGPLGQGLETLMGWLVGYGRYALPLVLVALGVAFLRRGHTASPVQLLIGWSIVALAALGLLQVFLGPAKISDGADEVVDAGGYIGALVGLPLEALLAPAGAAVVLVALLLGGAMIVTRTSIRTFARNTGGFLAVVGAPLGRAAKSGISNISTLSSDRDGATSGDAPIAAPYDVAGEASELAGSGSALYDFAAEGDELASDDSARKRRRVPKPTVSTGSQPGPVSPDGTSV
ncbi:MAG TPA: DNA translocase FtsK 4TM domain-containing protein, partial [Ilumatobacteraceae bacterium]|nr:DNA translocase FtsK 4TM domain-containing protein [Ilumatobacteraceae bacterium]